MSETSDVRLLIFRIKEAIPLKDGDAIFSEIENLGPISNVADMEDLVAALEERFGSLSAFEDRITYAVRRIQEEQKKLILTILRDQMREKVDEFRHIIDGIVSEHLNANEMQIIGAKAGEIAEVARTFRLQAED